MGWILIVKKLCVYGCGWPLGIVQPAGKCCVCGRTDGRTDGRWCAGLERGRNIRNMTAHRDQVVPDVFVETCSTGSCEDLRNSPHSSNENLDEKIRKLSIVVSSHGSLCFEAIKKLRAFSSGYIKLKYAKVFLF